MAERILFLTGKLAEQRLHRVLQAMHDVDFTYEVRNIGVSVAALMTAGMIQRRLGNINADRVIVPGLCRGDLEALSAQLGVTVIRGPEDLKGLPGFFGRDCQPPDLSRYDVSIFAEIVEAAQLDIPRVLERAARYREDGADVIDIGCLPETDFPHLEETVQALHDQGHRVSIDSLEQDELLRGGRAGADYLLSLNETTLWIADEVNSVPVLIPAEHGDLDSLGRAVEGLAAGSKPFIADSILDPIHFGFTDSIIRYHALRNRYPDIDIMMGIGNLTELTEADTTGINAMLFGLISELGITSVLTTEVSPHACSAVREADRARRIMYAAREDNSLPKGLDSSLLVGHARKPFSCTLEEITELAQAIRDPSYRVQLSSEGIHVFNRDGMLGGTDPYALFPLLQQLQDDAPHAFYMGVELARAQIAWQLGKAYRQDEELDWGAAVAPAIKEAGKRNADSGHGHAPEGTTLQARRKKGKKQKAS
ncbi:MAG: DUF6513 domain-containing protein [Gammaproteobacteria bacterium]